jgi:hypothetical protein
MNKRTVDLVVQKGETEQTSFSDVKERVLSAFLGYQRIVAKYFSPGEEPTETISISVPFTRKQLRRAIPKLILGMRCRLGDENNYLTLERVTGGEGRRYNVNLFNRGSGNNYNSMAIGMPWEQAKEFCRYALGLKG